MLWNSEAKQNGRVPALGELAGSWETHQGELHWGETQIWSLLAAALWIKGVMEEAVGSKEPEGSVPGEKGNRISKDQHPDRDPSL